MLAPAPLNPGDIVRIIAPSSPFDRTLFWRGLGVLSRRYRLRFRGDVCASEGFLAGSDARRLAELREALNDTESRAIFAARGGYGLTRLLPALSVRELRRAPQWLVGFSDVTALHLAYAAAGLMSLHATNVTGLGRSDARAHADLFGALEAPLCARTITGEPAHPGRALGPLVGGNLSLFHACATAGRFRLPEGCILAVEDVAESSYQIDRMLDGLINSGSLDQVAGIALGQFHDCRPGRFAVPVVEVLRHQFRRLHVPMVDDLAFGHGRQNRPLTFGAPAELDGSQGTLVVAAVPRSSARPR